MKGLPYSVILYIWKPLKDGSYPIFLRVTKNRLKKYFSLNLSAHEKQWDKEFGLFKIDKRLNSNYEQDNDYIKTQLLKAKKIIEDFERKNINWTLNQFEDAFYNYSKQGKVKSYFEKSIQELKITGNIGNAVCYQNVLSMLMLFDKKLDKRVFSEIDMKYVKAFDIFLQTPRKSTYKSTRGKVIERDREGCSGNTRKYYFKALRAVINKAIKEGEATNDSYPFGVGKFEISKLGQETDKRYLPSEYLLQLKTMKSSKSHLEFSRLLFLFSYFCYGMSFMDMAMLTKSSIVRYENGLYISYKRNKTSSAKSSKPIKIKLTEELKELISQINAIREPVDDYLISIVLNKDLSGIKLYNHIKSRLSTFNTNLKKLSEELKLENFDLTSYVSRHTMAMTLQNNNIPREVISQILDHKDMKTTNTYLDSFTSNVIDEAVKVL